MVHLHARQKQSKFCIRVRFQILIWADSDSWQISEGAETVMLLLLCFPHHLKALHRVINMPIVSSCQNSNLKAHSTA